MAEVLWPLAVFAVEALALHSHGPVACPLSSYQCWRLALRSCHAIGVRRFAIFPSELTAKMRCVGEAAGRCNIGYRSVRTRQQPGRHPYPNLSSVRVWRFPGFGSKQPLKLPDWIASTTMAARVSSRRNVTRPIVVVLPFSSLLWFAGREAPGLFGFQFFPNLSFNRRIVGLSQTAPN